MATLVSFGGFVNIGHSELKVCRHDARSFNTQQWNGWSRAWRLPPVYPLCSSRKWWIRHVRTAPTNS